MSIPFYPNVFAKPSFTKNYFLEAQEKECLIKDPSSKHVHQTLIISSGQNFEAGILDLTNPEAVTWFKSIIKKQIWGAGVYGMMTDFGEYLPYHSTQAKLHSGIPVEAYDNRYPQEWATLHSELIQELKLENETVLFYRAAFTRSPGYINLMWAGMLPGINTIVLKVLSRVWSLVASLDSQSRIVILVDTLLFLLLPCWSL
jgi:alpha-glucosidase (family GH31 glycosyl hydrolase)